MTVYSCVNSVSSAPEKGKNLHHVRLLFLNTIIAVEIVKLVKIWSGHGAADEIEVGYVFRSVDHRKGQLLVRRAVPIVL